MARKYESTKRKRIPFRKTKEAEKIIVKKNIRKSPKKRGKTKRYSLNYDKIYPETNKEFNLSEKRKEMFEAVISLLGETHPAVEVIKTQIMIQDKEFISRINKLISKLKDPIKDDKSSGEYRILEVLRNEIDKLAGKDLI